MRSDVFRPLAFAALALLVVAAAGVLQPLSLPAFAAIVVTLTLLAAVSPVGVLMSVVVTLPYFYRPIDVGAQSFAASEILLAAAAAGTAGYVLLGLVRGRSDFRELGTRLALVMRSKLIWFLLVIVAAGIVSTFAGSSDGARAESLREWRWTLVEPLVFVGLLVFLADARITRILFAASLVVAGVLTAAHGLFDIVEGGVQADNVRRLSGPLPHPNALALFLVRPLALVAALAVLYPRWRLHAIPPLILLSAVTFGTFSRGAMIAIVALAAMLAIRSSQRTRLLLASSVAGMGVLAFVIAGDRMRSALEGGSVSLRLDIWTSAARMIRDSPVFGYGPDQFLYAYAPRYILATAWDERFTSHAHNLFADSWIRLGILGMFAACLALLVVARKAWQFTRFTADAPPIAPAAGIALAATLVHGMIDNAYFGHDLAMSAWLLAWLAFSPPGSSEEGTVP